MKTLLNKIKDALVRAYKLLMAYLPSAIPVGLTDFQAWAESVIELSGLPKNDSMVWTVSIMVHNLGDTVNKAPKMYFVKALRKAASNQIAAHIIEDLRTKKKAEAEEAKKAAAATPPTTPTQQPAEATASQAEASDEQSKQ